MYVRAKMSEADMTRIWRNNKFYADVMKEYKNFGVRGPCKV
jgi:hypothetical protein